MFLHLYTAVQQLRISCLLSTNGIR